MSALSIQPTYPIFTDIDGQPLEDGYVWIGTANLDPQTNPINVYWDAALTLPAEQPIRTLAGYPSNSGTPARLYVNSDYSIRVMNKNGSTVYSSPVATERFGDLINAGSVIYDPPFTGAVATTVEGKLKQTVSVIDFGADPTGLTDSTSEIQAAINYAAQLGNTLYFPAGVYQITTLTIPMQHGGIEWVGESMDTADSLKVNFYRGTVLISTAASGNVISCDGSTYYGNRGIQIKNISIKSQTSGFTIYLKRAPDRCLLEYVTIYNSNSNGSGVCFDSCWVGGIIRSCNFLGEIGASNIGIKVFNDLKAGGFVMESSSATGWYKGLEFGVWVYQATIKNTGLEGNHYGAYIWQGDNNLTLDTCHFEFNRDHGIHVENTAGIRITKCSFYRNSEQTVGVKAQIYINAGSTSYSYNTLVQNCYDFGLSSDTYFFYHVNCSYGTGVIDNNGSAPLPGATNTKGIYLGGSNQEHWVVTNNLMQQTTPYTNCELAKQFSNGLGATHAIRFGTTVIPSSDPNTLDDYEEGSWTPILGGDGGQSGQAYTKQVGYYQKIGRMVYFTFEATLSTEGTVSLEAVLKGLPFTVADNDAYAAGYVTNFNNLGINVVALTIAPAANGTQAYFRNTTAASADMTYPISFNLYTNTTSIRGGGMYLSA